MDKIKLVLSGLYYPFAMLSYFRRALERRDDVELFTMGAFTGQYIPWGGGMNIPMKYRNVVDLPLPINLLHPTWESVKDLIPWRPDLVLTIDAGWSFANKPDCLSAHVGTDPHCLDYFHGRLVSDYFFNMQYSYIRDGDILLPYAFDPQCHIPTQIKKEYDCAIVGLHYSQRDEWVRRLRNAGVTVNYRIGDIYDEYRDENNKAWIGLNWSSLQDVNARAFEIMAMGLVPVMNRLPGLDYIGFDDGRHYLGFSSMDEAVEKVQWAISHREYAEKIANNAHQFVHERNMSWDSRVQTILETCGLVSPKR